MLSEDCIIIKKFINRLLRKKPVQSPIQSILHSAHSLSKQAISPSALKVLHRLKERGFNAYLVGGGVRDLLLGKIPKDFDVATDARPEQIKQLFRNCWLIGRRFRLAHIRFGHETIEVTTFRAKDPNHQRVTTVHGMLLRDNVYGSIAEDAWRRDFTINALYYNIVDNSLVDYCGGLADIGDRLIRVIGEPSQRYQEDPIRLLRAIRFASKLDFELAPETAQPIPSLAPLLQHVPAARLFDEVVKLLQNGHAAKSYHLLKHYHLFTQLFPASIHVDDAEQTVLSMMACQNADQRVLAGKTVSPAFLFAVFLWPALQSYSRRLGPHNLSQLEVYQRASQQILREQQKRIAMPRYYNNLIKTIWELQGRLEQRRSNRVLYLLRHPHFRAAYDFLLLRAAVHEIPADITSWWTHLLQVNEPQREWLIKQWRQKSRRLKSRLQAKPQQCLN